MVINPDTRAFRANADRQIKQALAGLRYDIPLNVDAEASVGAIRRLQQRIRQLGLADFLDLNIPVGRLVAQVQLIKRLLNQAHVADALEVNLDQASLARQLAVLRKVASSVEATIPVTFDVSSLPVMGPIAPLTEKIRVGWDIPRLKPLADEAARGVSERIPVEFDIGKLPVMGPVGNLSEKTRVDTSAAQASLAALGKVADGVRARMGYLDTSLVKTSLDSIAMARAMASGNNALAIMSGDLARSAESARSLAAIGGDIATLSGILKDLAATDEMLAGQSARLDVNFRDLARAQGLAAVAARELVTATGGSGGGGGGLAGALAGASAAFSAGAMVTGRWGGALAATIPVLGIAIRSVAFWHIALDLVIEALIAVGLAAVTITPALLVMANVGQDIATHFQAVHTVTESLGQSIGPLTGGFDKLAHAMAPQVIEAFGGAMNAITGKTGLFGQAVVRVVPLINTWIAKIDLWSAAQSGLGKFITAGIGYLTQFADIIGNVVSALGQLLTKDPGIAKFLLDVVNGAALLLKAFSALPAPIVVSVLALHGIYVWGSVLAPLLLRLAGYVIGLAADFLLLAANPFTWVAGAVIALGLLAYQSTQASSGAKALTTAIDQGLANDTATQAILGIAAAVGTLSNQIQASSGPVNAMKQWNAQSETLSGGFQRLSFNLRATGSAFGKAFGDIPQMLSSWPALGRTAADFGHAIADIFSSSSGASVMAANNIKLYDEEINKLIAQQGTLFRVAGTLIGQGFSLAQAFALEDLAGVKAADSFELASQKVKNLITGYQDMSVQGGILLNSVNAITFASLQQQSKIADLNSAWTTFISTVTGGLSAFSTFQQQVSTIGSDLSGVAPAAIKGATALGGLSAASLQANLAFTQGVTDANSLINALTLQASAAGLGARGTDMLTAATKDTVAQLIPMAGHSKAAQAALIALAQQGGFPAGQSFQQLEKWVGTASGTMGKAGKSGGPATQLNSIMTTLATSADNLTTDVKNLSIALGQNLTQAESQAIVLARGGTKPFDDFARAIANTGVNSGTTYKAAVTLGDEFLALSDNNVPAAKKQFESFAIGGLGLTRTQADQLWNDVITNGIPALNQAGAKAASAKASFVQFAHDGLKVTTANAQTLWQMFSQQNIDLMATKAGGAKAQFIQLAMGGLHLTTVQAQQLWNMFVQQKLDEASAKAGETKRQFETLAGELGLTKTAADRLWDSLHKVAAGSPYKVTLHEDGTGLFTISGPGILKSQGAGGSGNAAGGLKAGGIIRMGSGPTADDVHAMVSKGETVVSAADSKTLAPAFAAVGVPGYKSGGIIPGGDTGSLAASTIDFHNDFARTMTNAMKAAMTKAMAAAEAAAAGSGSSIVAYARSFLGKIPYVFGGNSLSGGIDCSGFTQQVYGHFGIQAPRTSEAQFGWAKRTGPEPGGLAFYVSPAGGPPPGHVAIVQDGSTVISQGGGMGPKLENLHFLPLMGTGIPRNGFPAGAGGVGNQAISGPLQAIAQALLKQYGWASQWPDFNALETREAGWNMRATNPSSGAYGLAQFINGPSEYFQYGGDPNTGLGQLTAMMNYIAQRYPSGPDQAWAHETAFNWYKAGGIAGMASGGLAGVPPLGGSVSPKGLADPMAATVKQIQAVAAMRAKLAAYQEHEGEDYLGLRRAFLRGPAKYKSKAVMRDITRLYKQQGAEQVAYRHLAGAGLTSANLGALGSAASMVGETAGSRALTGLPGGHPGWAAGLRHWTSLLAGSGSAKLPAALTGIAALFAASRGHGTFTESAGPGSEWQYGTTGLAGKLVPQVADRGTTLAPGMNLRWNGLGRPEPLVPAGGATTIQLEITGSGSGTFDAFLLKWLKQNVRVRGGGSVQKAFGGTGFR